MEVGREFQCLESIEIVPLVTSEFFEFGYLALVYKLI